MTIWMLILVLVTGETVALRLPEAQCRAGPAVLADRGSVRVEVAPGRMVQAVAAECVKLELPEGEASL